MLEVTPQPEETQPVLEQDIINLLDAYPAYDAAVENLSGELADLQDPTQHNAFLGAGDSTKAFSIEIEGRKYVVRGLSSPHGYSAKLIDEKLAAEALSRGVAHVEKIVAASHEKGVVISELVSGKSVTKLSFEELKSISDKQVDELVDTIIMLSNRGVSIDPTPPNFMYDIHDGFTIIDLSAHLENGMLSHSAPSTSRQLAFGAGVLGQAGPRNGVMNKKIPTVEDIEYDYEIDQALLDLIDRYRTIIGDRIYGDELNTTLKEIDIVKETIPVTSKEDYAATKVKLLGIGGKALKSEVTLSRNESLY
jgi:hypothetical protein